MINYLLDLFFPFTCCRCSQEGHVLCFSKPCQSPIKEYYRPRKSWFLDGILASDSYLDEALKSAIHQLKYEQIKSIGTVLGDRMRERLGEMTSPEGIIVPVPLSRQRLRKRGYNQSQVIAASFARDQQTVLDILKRTKNTTPQVNLSRKERLVNMQNVFSIIKNDINVKDKIVYVVDDVATTGATLNACAYALKKAGARQVYGLVAARD